MSIERITENKNGQVILKEGISIETAIALLAKYEDTALAPDEIASKAILTKMYEAYTDSTREILNKLVP